MKIIKPDFYDDFKCIANNCKASCCSAGWSIDVDAKSLSKYVSSKDDFLKDVNNYVQIKDGKRVFKQSDNNCVFFENGLCKLVLKYGDKYLCDVCRDYPRFYNFLGDITEIGLSLDCEEVCRIVLNHKDEIKFLPENCRSRDVQVQKQLDMKNKIIQMLQQKSADIGLRIVEVLKFLGSDFIFDKTIFDLFDNFEWLNYDYKLIKNYLFNQEYNLNFSMKDFQVENILVCFVYRYFSNKKYKSSDVAKFNFCLFCTFCCDKLSQFSKEQSSMISSFCRQIESSYKNVQILLDYFDNK